jgi:hypothetical protein
MAPTLLLSVPRCRVDIASNSFDRAHLPCRRGMSARSPVGLGLHLPRSARLRRLSAGHLAAGPLGGTTGRTGVCLRRSAGRSHLAGRRSLDIQQATRRLPERGTLESGVDAEGADCLSGIPEGDRPRGPTMRRHPRGGFCQSSLLSDSVDSQPPQAAMAARNHRTIWAGRRSNRPTVQRSSVHSAGRVGTTVVSKYVA